MLEIIEKKFSAVGSYQYFASLFYVFDSVKKDADGIFKPLALTLVLYWQGEDTCLICLRKIYFYDYILNSMFILDLQFLLNIL